MMVFNIEKQWNSQVEVVGSINGYRIYSDPRSIANIRSNGTDEANN